MSDERLEPEPSHTISYYGSGNGFDVHYMILTRQVRYFNQEEPLSLALRRARGLVEILEQLDEEYAGSTEG